jgi:hypothetical protein
MLSYLDFDKNKTMLWKHGRENIQKSQDLKDELVMELNSMILFASGGILISMQKFVEQSSQRYFQQMAVAMRKDLWGGSISTEHLKGISQ